MRITVWRALLAALVVVAAAPALAFDLRGWFGARTISIAALPPEGRETLALIRRGGPFPYRKDGSIFHNRERRLPAQQQGYYREYTVPTPGERDRGARRIVVGRGGEFYYTDNHYRNFRRIRE